MAGTSEALAPRQQARASAGVLAVSGALLAGLLIWAYWPVIPALVAQWWNEDEYSHGFLILPISGWLIWLKRDQLAALPLAPAHSGLAVMALAIAMYIAGTVGADLFLQRVSMVTMVLGAVLFTAGWAVFRALAFPLAYLYFMVPLPGIVLNTIAFPLQLLAAQIATTILQACHIPVFREGNVLHLAAASLDVEEACSGIRSLLSLTALALLMMYLSHYRRMGQLAVLLLIVPVTIAANVCRVAAMGFIAPHVPNEATLERIHDVAGLLVFLLAAGMLVGCSRLLRRVGVR